VVPESSALSRSGRSDGGSPADLPSAEAESFHLIRARMRYFNVDRELRTLMIVSAAPGDGKTTIARNRRDIAERLHDTLAGAGAPLLGVIANGFKAGRGKGYGYGYGYDYTPAKPVQPSGPPESGPGSVDGVSPDGAGSVEQPAVPTAGP
jgi:Mrp family chromosome partitioning ATPase